MKKSVQELDNKGYRTFSEKETSAGLVMWHGYSAGAFHSKQ